MAHRAFAYKAILKRDDPSTITSMVAYQAPSDGPLRAVIWSAPHREWIFAPFIASRVLFDDMEQHRGRPVDRHTAEQISLEILHTELPSEAKLTDMSDEGEQNGWNYGPPRS